MPEILYPGVYVEELPSNAHPIPGVQTGPERCAPELPQLERPAYFAGQMLTAEDLQKDQEYARQKRRRHNWLLHGWGVVCGLLVTADPTADEPWRVRVGAGLALSPGGDEVLVPVDVAVDLAKHRPGPSARVFIGVRYAEYPAQPVPRASETPDDIVASAVIQDAVSIGCLAELPESHRPGEADPWVVLAKVQLPAAASTPLSCADIDRRSIRRIAADSGRLQAHLRDCRRAGEERQGGNSLTRWIRMIFGGG